MSRPSPLRAALVLAVAVATAMLTMLSVPAAPAQAEEAGDPLRIHLDTITPVVPASGNVRMSGTVTNTTGTTFTRVNLHAFASSSPISDASTLAASAEIDPEEFVGERITVPGTFDTVDSLPPGATSRFSLSVPVEVLGIPRSPGVYWMGVHAFGNSITHPRDDFADGRARTFIPVLPEGRRALEAAVVLPLRATVRYNSDGSVANTQHWLRSLTDGRLDNVLDVAEAGAGTDYTWLVDPAVLGAVVRLAAGNPTRSLAPDPTVDGQGPEQPDEDTGDEADGTGGDGPDPEVSLPPVPGAEEDQDLSEEQRQLSDAATAWLDRFVPTTTDRSVLVLPYGDLDVSAAARHAPERYDEARTRSRQVIADLGITGRAAVVPDEGVLSASALRAVPPDALVMLGDTAFAAPPTARNSVVRLLGRDVVVTSAGAQSGGPGPTRADDPLAMRQRLLSEATLRVLSGSRAPVVLTLPATWNPRNPDSFFSAFDQRWLDSVPVPEITERSAPVAPASSLAYTQEDQQAELDATSFVAASRLTESAALLEQVLTLVTTIEQQALDEALVTLGQRHRSDPEPAVRSATESHEALTEQLASIRLEVPRAVTLSSSSGPLGPTIVNGLDQPVTVAVKAVTDDGLTLTGQSERRLPAGARGLLRFEATANRPGMHDLRLEVTSVDGTPLGSAAELPVRATQISGIIWVAMALGAVLLFGAIGVRLRRQLRERRKREAADEEPTENAAEDE